jgi:hypothetical protein
VVREPPQHRVARGAATVLGKIAGVVSRELQPGAGAGEQQPARLRAAELHVERVPRRVESDAAVPERWEQPRLAGLVRSAVRLQHVLQGLAERQVVAVERVQQAVVDAVRSAEHL